MSSYTYPDGSVLVSSALTVTAMQEILQPLVLGMLGQPTPAPTSPLVRFDWPGTAGAPFGKQTDDMVYVACTLKDDPYDKIRDKANQTGPNNSNPALSEVWNYTRVWEIKMVLYGPDSFDYARAVRSALFQDYFCEALSLDQLFPMSDFPEVIRAPEEINKLWYERSDFSFELYECVTESILRQTILSAEIIVEESLAGEIADVTVTAS